MKSSPASIRGWRRALGLSLCAYFAALSVAVHGLHTDAPGHRDSCAARAAAECADDHTQVTADTHSGCCDDAARACLACLYLKSCVGGPAQPVRHLAPDISPTPLAAVEAVVTLAERRSPAVPRAPPAYL